MPESGETKPHRRPARASAKDLLVVVLAAGQGTRMRSGTPKVLHRMAGETLISYPIRLARALGASEIVVVHAPGEQEAIQEQCDDCHLVAQPRARGTGDAVNRVPESLRAHAEVLVLYGDVPLLRLATIRRLVQVRRRGDYECALLAARVADPTGYGRVVDGHGNARIVEELEATEEEAAVNLVNTGVACFRADSLWPALKRLRRSSTTGEVYLTDVFGSLARRTVVECPEDEALGVNDRWQLAAAEAIARRRKARDLAESGVTIVDPRSTYIDWAVAIESDATIEPFTFLRGKTSIGAGSRVGPFAEIDDCRIGRDCVIGRSHLVGSTVEDGVDIGPFNRLRAGSVVAKKSRIGSFAEIKNTLVGPGSDVHHFSYLGDAVLGRDVNIGAGTVTANYDGQKKTQTVIGDGVFIGSDSTLVAPVTIGDNAYTAAGSVISRDVEAGSLAIERTEQRAVGKWAYRRRAAARNPR